MPPLFIVSPLHGLPRWLGVSVARVVQPLHPNAGPEDGANFFCFCCWCGDHKDGTGYVAEVPTCESYASNLPISRLLAGQGFCNRLCFRPNFGALWTIGVVEPMWPDMDVQDDTGHVPFLVPSPTQLGTVRVM